MARKKTQTEKSKQSAGSRQPGVTVRRVYRPSWLQRVTAAGEDRLIRYNRLAALLHGLQAAAVLWLSDAGRGIFEITTNYLTQNDLASAAAERPVLVGATRQLFDINLAYLVALFFALSAVAHTLIATVLRRRYLRGISQGINTYRWYEYALSASVMIVAIGLLSGISDLSTLLMLFALTAFMNQMGLAMERYNQGRERPDWLTYIIGSVAGAVPWLVVAIYLAGAQIYGSGVPGFVYWIYVSIFIFFNCFALNMWLQYRRIGPWRQYRYGEMGYVILSLVAKSLLAWQIFAGSLRP